MLIYEVNLEVDSRVFSDYLNWLKPHIHDILSLDGFLHAELLYELNSDNPDFKKITVRYGIDTLENYQNYIDMNAQQFRSDALKQFQGLFTAHRRLFERVEVFSSIGR